MHDPSGRKEREVSSCQKRKREGVAAQGGGGWTRARVCYQVQQLSFWSNSGIGDTVSSLNEAKRQNEKPHERGCLKGRSVVIRFSEENSTCQHKGTRRHVCALALGDKQYS